LGDRRLLRQLAIEQVVGAGVRADRAVQAIDARPLLLELGANLPHHRAAPDLLVCSAKLPSGSRAQPMQMWASPFACSASVSHGRRHIIALPVSSRISMTDGRGRR